MAKFVKGQSGNPGGLRKDGRPAKRGRPKELRALIEHRADEIVDYWFETMHDTTANKRDRTAASQLLAEHCWGKPTEAPSHSRPNGEALDSPAVVILPSNGYEVLVNDDGEVISLYSEDDPNERLRLEDPEKFAKIFGPRGGQLAPPPLSAAPAGEEEEPDETVAALQPVDTEIEDMSDAELLRLARQYHLRATR